MSHSIGMSIIEMITATPASELRRVLVPLLPFVDAHRDDGRRFIVHADEILTAFVELEREVLTTTFYLQSIQAGNQ
jgi:hypothetical protein